VVFGVGARVAIGSGRVRSRSYIIVEVAITEQSSTTSNHRPETFPSTLLSPLDAGATFDIGFRVVVAVVLLLDSRSHNEVVCSKVQLYPTGASLLIQILLFDV
jgi:hypothetical protein